ncbi:ribokinase [Aquamicrobium zhengzhouense]|uniref:Ribokinase n=1 Tax=Aquamicrobium zhengzhouense TaxID=2781738 RepID=A0ABS0SEX4_9HYPH|nr:ribokinase [Aquamicrobium zhengzhouense]MBI1621852.1 ribokinase [Aquamicrobium zhengzhouense]
MIVVIGSINLDLIANVERLPRPGETVPGTVFTTSPGGKGANQALAARRAGAEVKMVGAVGNDPFAGQALALLRESGADLSTVRTTEGATGIASIMVGADGENIIAVIPGGNGEVQEDDIAAARLKAGNHVLLQHEIPLNIVKAAIVAAREAGAVSILNTAPFRKEAASFLAETDYVVANETEFDLYADALALEGDDREARMRDFVARTSRTVVVTLGGDGVVAATPDEFLRAQGLKIEPVDTVGAGDTFCGYLAAGLADGLPLESAMRRAAIAGSLACLAAGAQPAIPHAADVDAAM